MTKKHADHGTSRTHDRESLGDGFSHGFKPLSALDPGAINDFDEMAAALCNTAFGGRNLGEAVDVLTEMVQDPRCTVVLTLSGAMTVGKMGLVICDMIDQGMVQAVVSTGALVAHGFVESAGMSHFKYETGMDDTALYEAGYNRVYDTLELERNLDDVEVIVHAVLDSLPDDAVLSSHYLCNELGRYLSQHTRGRGVLKSAFEKQVPVFIPAFTDSELGLDIAVDIIRRRRAGLEPRRYDPYQDLFRYTELIEAADRIGIFTIGGGVPRNWAQQVGPYIDIREKRLGDPSSDPRRFMYAVRVCPEPVHWGGMSGCSYSEGISWGKFVPPAEGGRFAEVFSDATIAWPIIVKAVQQRIAKRGKRG